MPLRPYFKLIIPGAVLTGEGASLTITSLLYIYIFNRIGNLGVSGLSVPGMITQIYVLLIIIGVISICIGVPLLIAGLVQRSNYPSSNYPSSTAKNTLIQPDFD